MCVCLCVRGYLFNCLFVFFLKITFIYQVVLLDIWSGVSVDAARARVCFEND